MRNNTMFDTATETQLEAIEEELTCDEDMPEQRSAVSSDTERQEDMRDKMPNLHCAYNKRVGEIVRGIAWKHREFSWSNAKNTATAKDKPADRVLGVVYDSHSDFANERQYDVKEYMVCARDHFVMRDDQAEPQKCKRFFLIKAEEMIQRIGANDVDFGGYETRFKAFDGYRHRLVFDLDFKMQLPTATLIAMSDTLCAQTAALIDLTPCDETFSGAYACVTSVAAHPSVQKCGMHVSMGICVPASQHSALALKLVSERRKELCGEMNAVYGLDTTGMTEPRDRIRLVVVCTSVDHAMPELYSEFLERFKEITNEEDARVIASANVEIFAAQRGDATLYSMAIPVQTANIELYDEESAELARINADETTSDKRKERLRDSVYYTALEARVYLANTDKLPIVVTKPDGVFDLSVFKVDQQMRLPKQRKALDKRTQQIVDAKLITLPDCECKAELSETDKVREHLMVVYNNRTEYCVNGSVRGLPKVTGSKRKRSETKSSGAVGGKPSSTSRDSWRVDKSKISAQMIDQSLTMTDPRVFDVFGRLKAIPNRHPIVQPRGVWLSLMYDFILNGGTFEQFAEWDYNSSGDDSAQKEFERAAADKESIKGYRGSIRRCYFRQYPKAELRLDVFEDSKFDNAVQTTRFSHHRVCAADLEEPTPFDAALNDESVRSIVLCSQMNTGKTYGVFKYIREQKAATGAYLRVIFVTCRRSMASKLATDARETYGAENVAHYTQDTLTGSVLDRPCLIIQAESTTKLFSDKLAEPQCDILVLDEVESLVPQLVNSHTNRYKFGKSYQAVRRLIGLASRVIFMDHFIHRAAKFYIGSMLPECRHARKDRCFCKPLSKTRFLLNTHIASDLTVRIIPKRESFKAAVVREMEELPEGKQIVMFSTSKAMLKSVAALLTAKYPNFAEMSSLHTGESVDTETLDANAKWAGKRFIGYTSTITVGVSYEAVDTVHKVFAYCGNVPLRCVDVMQALRRARNIATKEIVMHISTVATHGELRPLSVLIKEMSSAQRATLAFASRLQNTMIHKTILEELSRVLDCTESGKEWSKAVADAWSMPAGETRDRRMAKLGEEFARTATTLQYQILLNQYDIDVSRECFNYYLRKLMTESGFKLIDCEDDKCKPEKITISADEMDYDSVPDEMPTDIDKDSDEHAKLRRLVHAKKQIRFRLNTDSEEFSDKEVRDYLLKMCVTTTREHNGRCRSILESAHDVRELEIDTGSERLGYRIASRFFEEAQKDMTIVQRYIAVCHLKRVLGLEFTWKGEITPAAVAAYKAMPYDEELAKLLERSRELISDKFEAAKRANAKRAKKRQKKAAADDAKEDEIDVSPSTLTLHSQIADVLLADRSKKADTKVLVEASTANVYKMLRFWNPLLSEANECRRRCKDRGAIVVSFALKYSATLGEKTKSKQENAELKHKVAGWLNSDHCWKVNASLPDFERDFRASLEEPRAREARTAMVELIAKYASERVFVM